MRVCKHGKVKSGPRKGRCRKHPITGAAKAARSCKGNKGSSFGACVRYVTGAR
jgi:hypothetical protein